MSKQLQLKTFMDFEKMKQIENLELETKLISLEDRKKGYSIVIEVSENIQKKKDYFLYYMVHDKSNFDNLYRDVWCTPFALRKFTSLNLLEKQLNRNLRNLEKYLENECEGFEGY